MSNPEHKVFQYINEIAWTNSFSSEIGFLDFDCLQDYPSFNLTGGIFNTKDFNTIGGFDSSIKVAFNYEYLLRLTKKELKVYVVPKEGYVHCVGRKGSLTDEYNNTLTNAQKSLLSANAVARLQAWAVANGDAAPYDGNDSIVTLSADMMPLDNADEGNNIVIVVIVSMMVVPAFALLLVFKKRARRQ